MNQDQRQFTQEDQFEDISEEVDQPEKLEQPVTRLKSSSSFNCHGRAKLVDDVIVDANGMPISLNLYLGNYRNNTNARTLRHLRKKQRRIQKDLRNEAFEAYDLSDRIQQFTLEDDIPH